jgi:hypothetical protein
MQQPELDTKAVDHEEQFFIPSFGHPQLQTEGLQTATAVYTCDRNGYHIRTRGS